MGIEDSAWFSGLGEKERDEVKRQLADMEVRTLRTRRERIATAALQGLLTRGHVSLTCPADNAIFAVEQADALIRRLDRD